MGCGRSGTILSGTGVRDAGMMYTRSRQVAVGNARQQLRYGRIVALRFISASISSISRGTIEIRSNPLSVMM